MIGASEIELEDDAVRAVHLAARPVLEQGAGLVLARAVADLDVMAHTFEHVPFEPFVIPRGDIEDHP